MTCRFVRSLFTALALVASSVACSHGHADPVATATPAASDAASATPAAVASDALDGASVNAKRESVSKNGVVAAMGIANESDLAEIGLPIYPTVALDNTFLVKHVDKRSSAYRLQVSVKDGVTTVADWYAKKLGPSFRSGHATVLGGLTSFSRVTPTSNESILLQSQRDANLGIPLTTITLTVTKRR